MTHGSHQKTIGTSQVHLTPRWIIDAWGPLDLDPCAADPRPCDCAKVNLCEARRFSEIRLVCSQNVAVFCHVGRT